MLTQQQLQNLSALSTSQQNFNDNRIAFETFGHHFNYNIAVTLANTYCFKGKPSMNADAMAGVVRRYKNQDGLSVCAYIRIIKLTREECILGTKRRDEADYDIPEHTFSFTVRDAEERGFLKQRQWNTMRTTMLHKRCLVALLRCFYPEIIGVTYSPDELAEFMITDEKERDAIIFQAIEGVKAPTTPPPVIPAPSAPPAPVEAEAEEVPATTPSKASSNPFPKEYKSVSMTASEALLRLDNMDAESIDSLSNEIKDYLHGYVYDANPVEHIRKALNRLRLKSFQVTIDRIHELVAAGYKIDVYDEIAADQLSYEINKYLSMNAQKVLETEYQFYDYLMQF